MRHALVPDPNHFAKNTGTEFATPSHHFYQLNEQPKGAKSVLKQLAIPCPHKVFGLQDVKKTSSNNVGTRENRRPSSSRAETGFAPRCRFHAENPSSHDLSHRWYSQRKATQLIALRILPLPCLIFAENRITSPG